MKQSKIDAIISSMRWIKVRSIIDGWVTLNVHAISQLHTVGSNGFVIFMISGSLILVTKNEGNRIIKTLIRKGINP